MNTAESTTASPMPASPATSPTTPPWPVEANEAKSPERTEPYCVLLVEDSEDEMLLVKYALEECGNGRYRLEWGNTLSQGKQRLEAGGIDIILLDLGLPGYSGSASFAAMHQAAPDLPIVVLTSDDREQTELAVMTFGAEDYLVKEEISAAHLLHSIRGALYRHQHRPPVPGSRQEGGRRGFAIGFIGAKGGVGTTTTMLNLASVFMPEREVIVLETAVDRSGFSHQLRAENGLAAETFATHSVTGSLPQNFRDLMTHTCLGNQVMFEPLRRSMGIQSMIAQARDILRAAASDAEFVLVDAGSEWDVLTQAVIAECQCVVLVVDRESSSMAAVRDWAQRFMNSARPAEDICVLLVDRSGLATSAFRERMQVSFGFSVLGSIPNANEQLTWALERRRPLAYLDRCDPYSIAMGELIGPLVQKAAEAVSA